MLRRPLVVIALVITSGVLCARLDEPDPVKIKLDVAKQVYQAAVGEIRDEIRKKIEAKIDAARSTKMIDKVDAVKKELTAFVEKGDIPKELVPGVQPKLQAARKAMDEAYAKAEGAYVTGSKDEAARAVRKEAEEFKTQTPFVGLTDSRKSWASNSGNYTYTHLVGKKWEYRPLGASNREEFEETARTKDYIEIGSKASVYVVRLYDGKALRKDKGAWIETGQGKWKKE